MSFSYFQLSKNVSGARSLWALSFYQRLSIMLKCHGEGSSPWRCPTQDPPSSLQFPSQLTCQRWKLDSQSPLTPVHLYSGGHAEKCLHGWFQRKNSFRTAFLPVSLVQVTSKETAFLYAIQAELCHARFLFKL